MTDEYVEKKGGISDLIVCILVAPFLFVISTYDSFRASHIASRVRQGKFDVVLLKEYERDAEEKILVKCEGLWDETKPTIKGSHYSWFKVNQSKYQDSPKPAWIRRDKTPDGNFYDVPYYGIFVGPKPIQQLRNWLKENGYYTELADSELVSTDNYTPQNFRLEYTASNSVETPHFGGNLWKNNERATLEVEGSIDTYWGIWNWDGERVSDINRRSYEELDARRKFSQELRDALLPVSRNLYRRTGLAFLVSLIWNLVYFVMSAIINVLPFIAAVMVWTTKSGARPPIPLLIFRYFGLMFTILFIPISMIMTAGGGGSGLDLWSAKWAALIWIAVSTLFGWTLHTILMNSFAKDELEVLKRYGRRSYWDEWDWPIHTATERERWTGVEETA